MADESSSFSAAAARRRLESIHRHLLPSPPSTVPYHVRQNQVRALLESNPVIIGGMVLDIHAKPSADPKPGTTTPGKVQYMSGGVARNIAECMSKLGSEPFMISIVGNDMAGDLLLKYWRSVGLCTAGIRQVHDITTPVVSNIFDCRGELVAAVASVEAVEALLTPRWINHFHHKISAAPLLMVDANLSPQSLQAACRLADASGVPVWFEPVSVIKSMRIAHVANYVTCTTPNENELVAMANALAPSEQFGFVKLEDYNDKKQPVEYLFKMLRPAMCCLLEKGIKLLVVTLGSNGVFVCCKGCTTFMKQYQKCKMTAFSRKPLEKLREGFISQLLEKLEEGSCKSCVFHLPAVAASVVSLTGAGDCLVGGVLAALSSGLDVMQSVAIGIAVAKAAVETEANVPPKISLTTIADEAKRTLLSAKQLWCE